MIIVVAVRSQHERYLVFVVVVLVVATQTDEHRQLTILQIGGIGYQVVGMHKHLHSLVLAQVNDALLIHCLRLVLLQVVDDHLKSLFVALHQLGLRGVGNSTDTWRQHIVHWFLVAVFLDVHCTHVYGTPLGTTRFETVLVEAPLATYQVKTAEAEHDGFLEARHEQSHETDAGEVADGTFLALIIHQGHTELIPVDVGGLAIT